MLISLQRLIEDGLLTETEARTEPLGQPGDVDFPTVIVTTVHAALSSGSQPVLGSSLIYLTLYDASGNAIGAGRNGNPPIHRAASPLRAERSTAEIWLRIGNFWASVRFSLSVHYSRSARRRAMEEPAQPVLRRFQHALMRGRQVLPARLM